MAVKPTPVTPEILEQFVTLFRGRGDAYGSWDGGCVRKQLSQDTFLGHLQGDELVGVYPLLPYHGSWYCVWGCSDIDVDDIDSARNLQTAFAIKGITSWVERTRKGYHIWVFADQLIPASTMRRAFLAAHEAIKYPAKEVNPKQESAGSGFGNYVRLPYPNVYKGYLNERVILDDQDEPMPIEQFLSKATTTRATLQELEAIAGLWKPPVRHIITTKTTGDLRKALHKAGPVAYVVWRDGPLEGSDRSSTLYKLSCLLRDNEEAPGDAFLILKSADERWGKFYLRHDGDSEIIKIIERSYNITWNSEMTNASQ